MRELTRRTTLAMLAMAGTAQARAQTAEGWPDRPVRIIIPFVPGGPTDVTGRIIADRLREKFGQSFVVENRGGAGGMVGAMAVAQSAPNGATLLYTSSSVAIGASLQPEQNFNPLRDLTPISLVTDVATTVMVRPDSPLNSIADLVARARAQPGALSYGTSGVGSSNHLTAALLAFTAGIEMMHVPFRGTSQAMTALMARDIEMVFASTVESLPQYREGRVKVLGVAPARRVPEMPEVPTIGETLPGYEAPNWFALFGPAGLPEGILRKLEPELTAIGQIPQVRAQFAALGVAPAMSSPAAMRARMEEDVPKWRRVIQAANIRAE